MFNDNNIAEQWRNLAAELGLEYKEGEEGLRELFERMNRLQMASFSNEEIDRLEQVLESPLLMSLMGHLFPGAIVGHHRDYEILIRRTVNKRGGRSYPAVHIALFHPTPLDIPFSVKSQGFLNGLVERLFHKRFIQLNDPQLDPLVIIQGEDPHQIQLWLTANRVRQALLNLYSNSNRFELNHQGIMWHSADGNTLDAHTAHLVLDQLVNTADALNNKF